MSFLNKLKSSIYDPVFYSRVVEGTETGAFKFYLKLTFSLALIFAVASTFLLVPPMKKFFKETKEKIELNYPKDLEVKIQNGVASTNTVEPYFVKVPENEKLNSEMPAIENLLVIDTKNAFTVEKFEGYKTAVLLTADSVVAEDGNGKITITPLKKVPDFTVNQANITKWLISAEPISKVLSYIMPALIFVGVFIAYMFKLIYLLFAALLVWAIGKMKNLGLSYRQSYRVSLYAVTLPTLLGVLSYALHFSTFALLPTIIFMIAVWANLKKEEVSQVAEVQ